MKAGVSGPRFAPPENDAFFFGGRVWVRGVKLRVGRKYPAPNPSPQGGGERAALGIYDRGATS